ncbi:LOW QUALITY PROTEIN: steroid receptor-associated and regulated protein [Marmota flaviventris]|uniref:LOW QUALITY PROTEIN: steroid receptor-associated and regulated protein n=1 Tax=Marmota flaviventris TaxID=93162 RepID=UPI000FFFAB46|nr:steroid receptor-associated and regulated protein [Marmota flaviventris]
MAPSEDSRDCRTSLKDTGLETSSGGKRARCHKAIPTAHMTFVIDCVRGKQLSLAAPPVLPQVPSPSQGPVTLPMKTYIVFCGENQPQSALDIPLGGGCLAQAKDALPPRPPRRGAVDPSSPPDSPPCPQGTPKAKGRPLKIGPARSSTWGTVKGSLKALSSCVCGQTD